MTLLLALTYWSDIYASMRVTSLSRDFVKSDVYACLHWKHLFSFFSLQGLTPVSVPPFGVAGRNCNLLVYLEVRDRIVDY